MFKKLTIASLLLINGTQAAACTAAETTAGKVNGADGNCVLTAAAAPCTAAETTAGKVNGADGNCVLTAAVAATPVVEVCAAGAAAKNVDGGKVISAFFDNENCVGFTTETFKYARRAPEEAVNAKKYKCRVVSSVIGKTEVAPIEDIRKDDTSTNRPMSSSIDYMCPGLKTGGPYDQLFVTFNFPVVQSTMAIKGTDFTVTTGADKKVVPLCAIIDPGQEGNEGHQVQLLGDFGGKLEAEWPKAVQVTSETLMLNDIVAAKQISAKCLEIKADKVAWVKGKA